MGLTYRFLFNDASWDGSCSSLAEFRQSLKFCFDVSRFLNSQGSGLSVSYGFYNRPLLFASNVRDAVSQLNPDQKRLVSLWVDRDGPFWDRPALHSSDEYFECREVVVTDTALAEAAQTLHLGEQSVVISLPNSIFRDPVENVVWNDGPYGNLSVEVRNAISIDRVRELAEECLSKFLNYREFVDWAIKTFPHLLFARDELIEQMGTTIVPSIMDRGSELLTALNSIVESLKKGDQKEYDLLCQQWLCSERFSDSSDSEKRNKIYARRMTFIHPESGGAIACYWHGKVRTGVYRLHFEWPPPLRGERLFIAYFGPKLTKG